MHVKSAEFIKSAVKPAHYPEPGLSEIAFAGRSNVGKSSLIYPLLNRKRLVKTSATPGRTQLINFFTVNDAFAFVDLPGYGYARVPSQVRKTWGPMIETYLSTRKTLAAVVLIMDLRRTPGQAEGEFIDWLAHFSIPRILVTTKADKLSKTRQKKQLQLIADSLSLSPDGLILFSAKTGLGRDTVWEAIQCHLASVA